MPCNRQHNRQTTNLENRLENAFGQQSSFATRKMMKNNLPPKPAAKNYVVTATAGEKVQIAIPEKFDFLML